MKTFLFLILFAIISQNLSQTINVFISNSGSCNYCNGSETDPYYDIYAAFLESANNYSAVTTLIFQINPTSIPYYIFDSNITNVSPFENFKG